MRALTKKYQLDTNKYVWIALKNLIKKEWWYGIGPLLLIIGGIAWEDGRWWLISFGLIIPFVYLLFWMIQFAGLTQHEMGKAMFYKVSYEITGKQITMMMDAKHGMPIAWNNIKHAAKMKDAFILSMSKAQFFYLPFAIFKSDNDLKFTEALLKRKGLL